VKEVEADVLLLVEQRQRLLLSGVTQILNGGRNHTLRTIAEVADALRAEIHVAVVPRRPSSGRG